MGDQSRALTIFDFNVDEAGKRYISAFLNNFNVFYRHPAVASLNIKEELAETLSRARALEPPTGYHQQEPNKALRKRYPTFTAFSFQAARPNRDNLVFHAQLYLALSFYGKIDVEQSETEQANVLVFVARNTSGFQEATLLENLDSLFPTSFDRLSIEDSIDKISNAHSDSIDDNRKREALLVLRGILRYIRHNNTDTPESLGAPSAIVDQASKIKLATAGHHIRPDRMHGGRGIEAMPNSAAREAMRRLRGSTEKSDGERAAALLLIIVGNTGFSFDFLVATLLGIAHEGVVRGVRLEGSTVVIAVEHLAKSKLPRERPSFHQSVATEFTLKLGLYSESEVDFLRDYLNSSPLPEELKRQSKAVAKDLRNHVPFFTIEKFRGSVIQAILNTNHDLPLTQLLTGERLQASVAALHYIAYTRGQIEGTYLKALNSLYGDLAPSHISITEEYVGAPKAGISRHSFNAVLTDLVAQIKAAKNYKKPSLQVKKHRLLSKATLVLFAITTGHRPNDNILGLTMNDLSLSSQLVLLRDKRTGPKTFRRLAVLPDITRSALLNYVDCLNRMTQLPPSHLSAELRKRAATALAGHGPLFFQPLEQGELSLPSLLKTHTLFEAHGTDIYRHFVSTFLRREDAQPLLVETHLGHNLSTPVLGEFGSSSPEELASHLLPALNSLFPSTSLKRKRLPIGLYQKISAAGLQQLEIKEREMEEQLFWKDVPYSPDSAIRNKEELAFEAISNICPKVKTNPADVVISRRDAASMRERVISACYPNIRDAKNAVAELWMRLTDLRETYGAEVARPSHSRWFLASTLPINQSHIRAYEQLEALRTAYLDSISAKPTYENVLHAFVLFGDCPSYKVAEQWFLSAQSEHARTASNGAMVFPSEGGESRTVAGIPLQIFSKFQQSRVRRPSKYLADHWLLGLGKEDIEMTARLGRSMEKPSLLVDIINQVARHKEANVPTLIGFIENNVRGNGNQPARAHSACSLDTRRLMSKTYAHHERSKHDVTEILSLISNDQSSYAKKQESITALLNKDISIIGELIGEWACDLLTPNSNRRTGKHLARSTIRQYISSCASTLLRSLDGGHPLDFEPEELRDVIVSALRHSYEAPFNRAEELNRFFAFLHSKRLSPPLFFPIKDTDTGDIRSHILSGNEIEAATATLVGWSRRGSLTPSHALAIGHAKSLLTVASKTGMRRNEARSLYLREYFHSEENTTIFIRPHKERPIKTQHSRRYICAENLRVPIVDDQQFLFPSIQLHSEFNLVNSYLVAAIRAATGFESATNHDLRHTFGTCHVLQALGEADPTQRLARFDRLVAEIGHADIKTTLEHYSHASHYGNAVCSARKHMARLSAAHLSRLISSPERQLTKAAAKQRQYRNRKALAWPLFQQEKGLPAKTMGQFESASLPTFAATTEASSLCFTDCVDLLQAYVAGAKLDEANNASKLSNNQLTIFLERILECSKPFPFKLIPEEILIDDLRLINTNQQIALSKRKPHRKLNREFISNVLSSVGPHEHHFTKILRRHEGATSLLRGGETRIKIAQPILAQRFVELMRELRVPLTLVEVYQSTYELRGHQPLNNKQFKYEVVLLIWALYGYQSLFGHIRTI